MYREYFGLEELPFSIAPDPRYLYMSEQHREALAHLVYGINSEGGFVLLTGEVGTGKTTVCRCLLEQIPENFNTAFIINSKVSAEELLASICDELRIPYAESRASSKLLVDRINEYLLDAHGRGRKTVLIIEEAQNLATDALEQVRLLTNLETNQCKLLQIIMVGQPELRDLLSKPELRQLAQRITARFHLGPLSKDEVAGYVTHRLAVAGVQRKIFPDSTTSIIFRLSRGIPRLINLICDRALLGAYVHGSERVDRRTLKKAAQEVFGKTKVQRPGRGVRWVLGILLPIGILIILAVFYVENPQQYVEMVIPKFVKQHTRVQESRAGNAWVSQMGWPSAPLIHGNKEIAYQSLFKQWNITYRPHQGSACEQARAKGLNCLDEEGSFRSLVQLNRPAVLKLYDNQGSEFYATLTAVHGENVTLIVGDETRVVSINEIEKRWLREYFLLWKMPPGYESPLMPGQRGKVVPWLEKQLSHIQGRNMRSQKSMVFDNILVKEVKDFQRSMGLEPDGVLGPKTIIHLNTRVCSREPLLSVGQEDR
ncbi:MAG: AAA family ATPase [Nitrospira sp.]|nr:AAA family ATPase [Nitrospira sp.]